MPILSNLVGWNKRTSGLSRTGIGAAILASMLSSAPPAVAQALMVGADGAIHLDEFSEVDPTEPVLIEQTPDVLQSPDGALPTSPAEWQAPQTVCPHCQGALDPTICGPSYTMCAPGLMGRPPDLIYPMPMVMSVPPTAYSAGSASCSAFGTPSLAQLLGLEQTPWLIGGWTQAGYQSNNVPLSQAYNDLLSFNDVPDHFHLHQQWLYIGRQADGSRGPDIGGRVDMVYGVDAQKTQAFGNPRAGVRESGTFDASLDHGEYGWAIPQAYGEAAWGGVNVKVGHFLTPLGYETVPSTRNFFFTHSYTHFNSEPFTHTGVLATITPTSAISLYGGWSLGWDTGFDQLNGGNTAIGGFVVRPVREVALSYMSTFGNFGWKDGGSKDSFAHSVVMSADLTDRLQYAFQTDLIRTDNPGVSQFDTISVSNYAYYRLTDRVRAGARSEWWKADGVSFNEVTAGLNVNALTNLVFRPEARYDWSPGIDLDETTYSVDLILSY